MKYGFLIINLFIKYLLRLISAFRHDRVTGLFSPARNSYKSRQNEVECFRHWTLEGKRTNKMNPIFSPSELRDNFLTVIGSRTQAEQESSPEPRMERFWVLGCLSSGNLPGRVSEKREQMCKCDFPKSTWLGRGCTYIGDISLKAW